MNVMEFLKSEKPLDHKVLGVYFLYTNAQPVGNKQDECELQI